MNWLQTVYEALPVLLKGTGYTMLFALGAMVGGLVLGTLVAVVRLAAIPMLTPAMVWYVSAMRGTPLLMQVFLIYYGLPSLGLQLDPIAAGLWALSLNAGAYLSETIRGALNGVPHGQWDAARSLGLTNAQTLRHIIGPQALRLAVPSLSNTLISLVKDTSLVSVIAVTELMLATKEVIATTFQPFPLYLAAAGIYWVLSAMLEGGQHRLERHFNKGIRRGYSLSDQPADTAEPVPR